LLLVVGALVWTFWPTNAESLYESAAKLMASDSLHDWETARRDYLEPLNQRFPDHPHKEQVDKWLKMIETRKQEHDNPLPGEAERFYLKGERLFKEGDLDGAKKVWGNLIKAFGPVEAEQEWVRRAADGLVQIEKGATGQRWESVRAALKHAAELAKNGKRSEAEKIWQAIEELYQGDPSAQAILDEVKAAKKKP
jgi:serine/threonine-protein kinase